MKFYIALYYDGYHNDQFIIYNKYGDVHWGRGNRESNWGQWNTTSDSLKLIRKVLILFKKTKHENQNTYKIKVSK